MVNTKKIVRNTLSFLSGLGMLVYGSCKVTSPSPTDTEMIGYLNSLSNQTTSQVNENVDFTANLEFVQGLGKDTLFIDPDGRSNPLPVIEQEINVDGPNTLDKVVSANMPNTGTFTPEAMLKSEGKWVPGNELTITPPPTYLPVENIQTYNSGSAGTLTGTFDNPINSDTSFVKVYSSYFNSDLETLLTNGDATLVDTVNVSGAGEYDFEIEATDGISSNTSINLYFASEDNKSLANTTEKNDILTAGMPDRYFNYFVTFTGDTLANGTEVNFKDKYGNVIETMGTVDNMVGGLMANVADNIDLYVEVAGYGNVDDFTVQNKVNYIDTINL